MEQIKRELELATLPEMPKRLDYRIGIIGAGFIVRNCHLEAYRKAGFNPVAITSLDLEQSKEVERLQQELAEARQQLEERRIMTEEAGSIAEAALRINRVFEAAQAAADQYLENIRQQAPVHTDTKPTDSQENEGIQE